MKQSNFLEKKQTAAEVFYWSGGIIAHENWFFRGETENQTRVNPAAFFIFRDIKTKVSLNLVLISIPGLVFQRIELNTFWMVGNKFYYIIKLSKNLYNRIEPTMLYLVI